MCRRKRIPDWAHQLHLELHQLDSKVSTIMALVQIYAFFAALDDVTTSLEAKIESLKTALPDADLSALDADVAALRALAAPTAEPPAEPA